MSRSCQSATFSRPTTALPRTTRASPQMRSATIGFRLCGIADEPFCPLANGSSTSRTSVRCEMADLGREALERRRDERQRREQLRVAVALEDLRRARRRLEPEPLARDALDLGIDGRVLPDRARQLADPQPLDAPERPARGRARAANAQPASLSPNVVGSAWTPCVRPMHSVSRCSSARSDDDLERAVQPVEDQRAGLLDGQRQRGVEHVRRGEAVVEPAPVVAQLRRPRDRRTPRRRARSPAPAGRPRRATARGPRRGSGRPRRPRRCPPRPSRRAPRARPRAFARASARPTRPGSWRAGSSERSRSDSRCGLGRPSPRRCEGGALSTQNLCQRCLSLTIE